MPGKKGSQPPKSELHRQLGEELRRLREAGGMTLRQFAAAISYQSDGYLCTVENGRATPSLELVNAYVRECGGNATPLQVLLDDIHKADQGRRREQRGKGQDTAIRPEAFYDPPDPGRLYHVVTSDIRFTMDERGAGTEVRISLAIKAKLLGVERYYTGWGYNGNTSRGVVEPQSGFGCRIGNFHESEVGAVNGYFLLDRAISPSDPEPYPFSFLMRLHTHEPAIPPTIGQFQADAIRHAVHLQFTPPALPARVWWFDVATALEVEDDPLQDHIFPHDPGGYYFKEFLYPKAGRLYGINWQWESRIEGVR